LNYKVLFVDDEMNVLKAIRRELLDTEFEVLLAHSAKEGLKILEEQECDVVVSDVKMPQMNGIRFLNLVKEKYPDIHRIILSGFVEQSYVISAIIKGVACTHFAKPWVSSDLKKSIAHILQVKSRLQNQRLLGVINSIERLPTLPELYEEFLNAINKDKPPEEIARVVDRDVSISTRILQVVNSVFFGGMPIYSTKRAIIQLGLNVVKDIVLTTLITEGMNWNPFQCSHLREIFLHSSLVNKAIKLLYEKQYPSLENEYTSIGITHDIGKIILLQYFPQQYQAIIESMRSNPELDFYQTEVSLGYQDVSHTEIGAYFLSKWNLANINIETAMYHHKPQGAGDHYRDILWFTHLANRLSNFCRQCEGDSAAEWFSEYSEVFSMEELIQTTTILRNECQ
jgi:HD-like signal output (HDOD) protein